MTTDADVQALLKRIEELEAHVRDLRGEVHHAPVAAAANAAAAAAPAAPETEELSADTLAVLSAAIAAFLGVKSRIKQVRLIGREVWMQQGRASIMASHRLGGRG